MFGDVPRNRNRWCVGVVILHRLSDMRIHRTDRKLVLTRWAMGGRQIEFADI